MQSPTRFNVLRGGESSRMMIEQWNKRHQWIGETPRMVIEQWIKRHQWIGETPRMVSCLVPRDCVAALESLINAQLRIDVVIVTVIDFC